MLLRALALSAVTLLLSACDECATTSLCGEPRIDVYGQAAYWVGWVPATDTEVRFERSSGPRIRPDTIIVRPDSEGIFHLRATATEDGPVRGRLVFLVDPPNEHYSWVTEEIDIATTRAIDAPRFIGWYGVGPFE